MSPQPTSAPSPSQTALRRAEKAAARVRGPAGAAGPALRLVGDVDAGPRLPSFLRAAPSDPHAVDARAGARLDPQNRITCGKLLKGVGWQAGDQLAVHCRLERRLVLVRRVEDHGRDLDGSTCACDRCVEERRAATALARGWVAVGEPTVLNPKGEPARVTAKGELALTSGMVRSASLSAPGEVLAVALPPLDAVLVTSVEAAVGALLAGIDVFAAGGLGEGLVEPFVMRARSLSSRWVRSFWWAALRAANVSVSSPTSFQVRPLPGSPAIFTPLLDSPREASSDPEAVSVALSCCTLVAPPRARSTVSKTSTPRPKNSKTTAAKTTRSPAARLCTCGPPRCSGIRGDL